MRIASGFNRYEYTETTIFDRDEETLVNQSLGASYVTRTTWGSASMSVSASQYLANLRHDPTFDPQSRGHRRRPASISAICWGRLAWNRA